MSDRFDAVQEILRPHDSEQVNARYGVPFPLSPFPFKRCFLTIF